MASRRSSARARRTRRRSRSLIPPQIPNFSLFANAYSKQSSRTTHPRHTSLASRVEAPRSGKKRSGSTPLQLACPCQLRSSSPANNEITSIGPPLCAILRWHRCNYNGVILGQNKGKSKSSCPGRLENGLSGWSKESSVLEKVHQDVAA